MGANCCVAAKEKLVQDTSLSTCRNVRHSPSWSFRRDNRTHIEDIMDNPTSLSHISSGDASFKTKVGVASETGFLDGSSPLKIFQAQQWHKSPFKTRSSRKSRDNGRGQSSGSDISLEFKGSTKSSCVGCTSYDRPTDFVPSTSSVSKEDPSSSRSHSLPSDPTSSRKAQSSPGYQLSRMISDSRIPSLNSLNENSFPEGRQSFGLSVCSNDLSMGGSRGSSSDGWSMCMLSDLASSQRERWSCDSENLSTINSKIGKLIPEQPRPVSLNQQKCKICSKLLQKKSPWSSHKVVSSNELSVVAVLFCGHAYHAECLDNLTPETDRHDPPCPVCIYGEKSITKLFGKARSSGRSNGSRIVVADTDMAGDTFSEFRRAVKGHRMGASSSLKNSFSKPFRQHLSIELPPSPTVSENESTRKKGYWARYWKD
ncbi:zinc finger, C3HC4 type, domain containing protein [Musa troglodytarum]|uniref:Zinc finger, C3HC4 type, domain containing protein n=1 Tax=Musa troglodytarum TaxID=320322 RepID=A0A9E7FQH1_9LILI|nr:zinc finger, C3HC4 type, domain containing protein [Musa troglodytarum]URD98148.1 zinc finger, C3HC4 type, domain containing protein [Musa troglodytarum]